VLGGETKNETAQNLILINAAAAIFVSSQAGNLNDAFNLAKKSLENGKAYEKLQDLIKYTGQNRLR
jgi:anthranilate phosphoribosyltransferase